MEGIQCRQAILKKTGKTFKVIVDNNKLDSAGKNTQ